MPTKPSDLATTFTGWFALQVLSSGNAILDRVEHAISSGGGGILKTVSNWLLEVVRSIFNSVVGFLNPAAPGAFAYIQTDPSWMETIALSTANAFSLHRTRILWLWHTQIPAVQAALNRNITAAHADAIHWASSLDHSENAFTTDVFNRLTATINSVHTTLTRDINNAHEDALLWTNKVGNGLTESITELFNWTRTNLVTVQNTAHAYTDKSVSSLQSKLTAAVLALGASIAALGTFITTVVVPDAIEAAVLALNAEASASMALQWEYVATVGNKAVVQLALVDLDPVWATNALSEIPALGIAGADADLVAGLKLFVDYLTNAGVPLYRNLKKFGEDTAELDGVISTVLLGGFTVAAVTEPQQTATLVVDTLANPLNDILSDVLDLFGLR